MENIPVGIAYVTDGSLIDDRHLDFAKVSYVVIGIATEISGGNPPRQWKAILRGFIGKAFGGGGSG
ncbi:MAG: hypothetical protein IID49_05760 [Proteobacteria bacterium]|nr:hypothetical protein [Pseudomonadota bacterium]